MIVLAPGVRYKITHQTGDQRYARESVLEFLGHYEDKAQFNARPIAGTQTFLIGDIISAVPVSETTKIYMNRRAPS